MLQKAACGGEMTSQALVAKWRAQGAFKERSRRRSHPLCVSPRVRPGVASQDESHEGPDLQPRLDDLVPVLSERHSWGRNCLVLCWQVTGEGADDCNTCLGSSLGYPTFPKELPLKRGKGSELLVWPVCS